MIDFTEQDISRAVARSEGDLNCYESLFALVTRVPLHITDEARLQVHELVLSKGGSALDHLMAFCGDYLGTAIDVARGFSRSLGEQQGIYLTDVYGFAVEFR